jgi:hypothetical protein
MFGVGMAGADPATLGRLWGGLVATKRRRPGRSGE